MTLSDSLEKYRPVVPNFGLFLDACQEPLPLSFWRNANRIAKSDFDNWFGHSPRITNSSWSPDSFRTDTFDTLPFFSAYLGGLIHIQEEVGMLPVMMLDPQPGERILDLCAAPGNKMAALSVKVGTRGTVVGNDVNQDRLGIARLTTDRMGLTNVVLTSFDAVSVPNLIGQFDRVLADVPCSCEGTTRKQPRVLQRINSNFRDRLLSRQTAILTSALALCRSGGRVVYSTCTYAPEECELVVEKVLNSTEIGREYSIAPVSIPNLTCSEGLMQWNGVRMRSEMQNAVRVYPHQNDTGGFFAVALDRAGYGSVADDPFTAPEQDHSEKIRALLSDDLLRLQIDQECVDALLLAKDSNKYYSLFTSSVQAPPEAMCLARGVKAINVKGNTPRLSTAGCQLLGPWCEDAYELSDADLMLYLNRTPVPLEQAPVDGAQSVLLFYKGKPVGRGAFRNRSGDWILESHFPRSFAGVKVEQRIKNLLL